LRQRLLELAGWQAAAAEGLYIARARHVQALRRVEMNTWVWPRTQLAAQAQALDLHGRRVAPGAERAERHHRRVQLRMTCWASSSRSSASANRAVYQV
jgi:hypothetical protein